jgi:hypothetical protein
MHVMAAIAAGAGIGAGLVRHRRADPGLNRTGTPHL